MTNRIPYQTMKIGSGFVKSSYFNFSIKADQFLKTYVYETINYKLYARELLRLLRNRWFSYKLYVRELFLIGLGTRVLWIVLQS